MTAQPQKRRSPAVISSNEFRKIVEKNLRKDRILLERLAKEAGIEPKDSPIVREPKGPKGKRGLGDVSVNHDEYLYGKKQFRASP